MNDKISCSVVSCSSGEFYEDAKYRESNRTIRTWQKRSSYSWSHQKHANQVKRYVMAQKKLYELCKRLVKSRSHNRSVCVGFGDWSGHDSHGFIKKCPGGPVKKFERILKSYCKAVSIFCRRESPARCPLKKVQAWLQQKKGTPISINNFLIWKALFFHLEEIVIHTDIIIDNPIPIPILSPNLNQY